MPPDLRAAVAAQTQVPAATAAMFVVRSANVQGDWAVITAASESSLSVASPSGEAAPPTEVEIVIAHRVGGTWQLTTESNTDAFCAALSSLPPGLLSTDERSYFTGCP